MSVRYVTAKTHRNHFKNSITNFKIALFLVNIKNLLQAVYLPYRLLYQQLRGHFSLEINNLIINVL
jgi:hypothetical protein